MSRSLDPKRSTCVTLIASALGLAALFGCGSSSFTSAGEMERSGDAHGQGDGDDAASDEDGDAPSDGTPADLPVANDGGSQGTLTSGGQGTATSIDGGIGISSATAIDDGVGISTDTGRTVDTCDIPKGDSQSSAALGGEDVPGNGLLGGPDREHPGGSDFDDYVLTLSGSLLVDSLTGLDAKLGVRDPTTIGVSYRRGTTDCSHAFTFIYRRCPNRDSTGFGREVLTIGGTSTGSVTLNIPAKNVFIDIVMTVTSGTGSRYGGCTMPFPLENHLYSSKLPAFFIP